MRGSGPLRRMASVVLGVILLAGISASRLPAGEEFSAQQLKWLVPRVLKLHLTQPKMDAVFMRRLVKQFLARLDPSHTLYLKSEAGARTGLADGPLEDLAAKIRKGDVGYFSGWVKEFKERQLAKDGKFFKTLDARKTEITRKVDTKEWDAVKFDEYPASEAERRQRLLLLLNRDYHLYKDYLSGAEAYQFAIQTTRKPRVRWEKVRVPDEIPKLVMKAFMLALDPHSEYLDAEDAEEFETSMARSFGGIGVKIRGCPAGAQVVEVIKGGPAFKSGLFNPSDQIVAVSGVPVPGESLSKIVKRIKGKKGTRVSLTLRKTKTAGKGPRTREVTVVRDTISLAAIRCTGKERKTPSGLVGIITVQNFYQGVAGDVAERIKELSKDRPLAGLVLDLRNNSGGLLEEAVQLAGLFIGEGPVVAERNYLGVSRWHNDKAPGMAFSGSLVVLANQFSASAAEIVTGALQDYGRAVVVGSSSQTHGKGTVQQVIDLAKYFGMPGRLKITVQQYFLAGGQSVQRKGVTPDIQIPGAPLIKEFLEKAYKNALPWAKIEAGLSPDHPDYKKYNAWKARVLPELKAKSQKRVAANKDFDVYRKMNEQAKRNAEKKEPKTAAGRKDLPLKATTATTATAKTAAPTHPPEGGVARSTPLQRPVKKPEDGKDPQLDEAVWIVSDMAAQWESGIAKK